MKKGSIQKRLTKYYLVGGLLTILFSLAAIIGCCYFLYRYEVTIDEMNYFNEFTISMSEARDAANYYIQTESDEYIVQFSRAINEAENKLLILKGSVQHIELQREVLDLGEICETLKNRMMGLKEYMNAYEIGTANYQLTADQHSNLIVAFEAAEGRYDGMRNGILGDINSFTDNMHSKLRTVLIIFAAMALTLIFTMGMMIRNISITVTEPIQILMQSASQIKEHNMDECAAPILRVTTKADEEIAVLADVFNDMLNKVKGRFDTLQENARIRQELMESHFRELQMQINPHFLFNTLNMASEKAYLEDADDTVEILEKVAAMFRYTLDFSGKAVKLSREIEELDNYVYIQEQRYGERIRFYFSLDEKHHNLMIPALTLQPLVENAIVHGIGLRTENGKITIQTKYLKEDNVLEISVADNGDGMPEEKLDEVRGQMEQYQGNSARIGLGNVYLRLQYFYEGNVEMYINSREGKGTEVVIRIPIREEMAHV